MSEKNDNERMLGNRAQNEESDGSMTGASRSFTWSTPIGFVMKIILHLIDKMPRRIQVISFLVFLILLVVFVLDSLPKDEIIIEGELRLDNGQPFNEKDIGIQLMSNGLYVLKIEQARTFEVKWILKVPRSALHETRRFTLALYNQKKGSLSLTSHAMFQIDSLRSVVGDDRIVQLKTDNLFSKIELVRRSRPSWFDGIFGWAKNALGATGSGQTGQKSRRTIDSLMNVYQNAYSPTEQTNLRDQLVTGGADASVFLVDSLKKQLDRGDKNIADYAYVLSGFPSLDVVASQGGLDNAFFASAVDVLLKGSEVEAINMSSFLKKLQDQRCLTHLFDKYDKADQMRKRAFINVLSGYASNTDSILRDQVKRWLTARQMNESSADVVPDIEAALAAFQ